MTEIEVRVTGKGSVKGDSLHSDAALQARCSLCSQDVDLTVAITESVAACRNCLRVRLDTASVASYRLTQPGSAGLPWGKVAG